MSLLLQKFYFFLILSSISIFASYMIVSAHRISDFMQEKYEKAMGLLAQMEKRVVMAESMLEATNQYNSGQVKAVASPR